MQSRPRHLIEHRPARVEVAQLAESPDQLRLVFLRPDRIAHGDEAAALDAVHEQAAAAVAEEERLVAEEREIRLTAALRAHDSLGAIDFLDRRRIRLRRGRAEKALDREDQKNAENAHGGAEESRRVSAEPEAPPQIARVFDVLVAEESEPRGRQQNESDRGDPSRTESLVQQRRFSIEVFSRTDDTEQHHRENQGLFVIRSLEELKDDADAQHRNRQLICRIEAALQSARENEERRSGDAAEEVRELDDRQRDEEPKPVLASGQDRGGA